MGANSQGIALKGSCRCGAVTYTSTTLPFSLTNCYCLTCRRLSGSPYLTFTSLPTAAVTFSPPPSHSPDSTHKITNYSDVATRTHCAACGSPISMKYVVEAEMIGVTMGSVIEESVKGKFPRLSKHIFLSEASKIGGLEIPDDGAERWERFSKDFQEQINAWRHEKGGLKKEAI